MCAEKRIDDAIDALSGRQLAAHRVLTPQQCHSAARLLAEHGLLAEVGELKALRETIARYCQRQEASCSLVRRLEAQARDLSEENAELQGEIAKRDAVLDRMSVTVE